MLSLERCLLRGNIFIVFVLRKLQILKYQKQCISECRHFVDDVTPLSLHSNRLVLIFMLSNSRNQERASDAR